MMPGRLRGLRVQGVRGSISLGTQRGYGIKGSRESRDSRRSRRSGSQGVLSDTKGQGVEDVQKVQGSTDPVVKMVKGMYTYLVFDSFGQLICNFLSKV